MGLDIFLGWPGQTAEEREALVAGQPASDKVGYLRSGYGEGSLIKWAQTQLGGRDWYWVFQYRDDQLQVVARTESGDELLGFCPDWQASRQRAEEAMDIARQIEDRLFLVPLPKPNGDPAKFPDEADLLDIYRTDREELTVAWSKFQGHGPPLKTAHGRFAADWAQIRAVMWCQFLVFKPHVPPTVDIQPMLVCEGRPGIHQSYIELLAATLRFIDLGQEKNGWLFWSG